MYGVSYLIQFNTFIREYLKMNKTSIAKAKVAATATHSVNSLDSMAKELICNLQTTVDSHKKAIAKQQAIIENASAIIRENENELEKAVKLAMQLNARLV